MDYFNYVGCFFFPSVYDKNNSMQLTNTAMGVERKQGDDLKHLATVVGGKKKNLTTTNLKSRIQNCWCLSADAT